MRKRRFIARRRSWHGNTLGALSVSGFAARRRAFEGSLLDVTFVSAANAYRPPEGCDRAESLVGYLAAELEQAIVAAGPGYASPPSSSSPSSAPPAGSCPRLPVTPPRSRQSAAKHDVLVIADEVMCGAGRCGTWRALEHDGVVPDIMSIAKGLAGGYIPLGATLVAAQVSQTHLERARRLHDRAHLFGPHRRVRGGSRRAADHRARPAARAGAHARARSFKSAVRALAVALRRGRRRARAGLLHRRRVGARPHDPRALSAPERGLSFDIGQRAFADGLICYPCSGNVDGAGGRYQ